MSLTWRQKVERLRSRYERTDFAFGDVTVFLMLYRLACRMAKSLDARKVGKETRE